MSESDVILNLTRSVLEATAEGNWEVYEELCDTTLTCFEPEALGNLVEGLEFHRFYFTGTAPSGRRAATTLSSPHVRMLGDNAAVISYVRITQVEQAGAPPTTVRCEESRVWEKQATGWKQVHFHRSVPPAA